MKTYNRFVNERINLKSPDKLVKMFSANISKDFSKFLIDNNKFFKKFVDKYYENDTINMKKLSDNLRIIFENTNESVIIDKIIQFFKSIIKLPVVSGTSIGTIIVVVLLPL